MAVFSILATILAVMSCSHQANTSSNDDEEEKRVVPRRSVSQAASEAAQACSTSRGLC